MASINLGNYESLFEKPTRLGMRGSNFNAAFDGCGLNWGGSHIARHTNATLSLIASKDVAAVPTLLGHCSMRQTEEYAKAIAMADNDLPEQVSNLIRGKFGTS